MKDDTNSRFVEEDDIWEMVPNIYTLEEAEESIKRIRTFNVLKKMEHEMLLSNREVLRIIPDIVCSDFYLTSKLPTSEELEKFIRLIILDHIDSYR